jgi:hypothetical protein
MIGSGRKGQSGRPVSGAPSRAREVAWVNYCRAVALDCTRSVFPCSADEIELGGGVRKEKLDRIRREQMSKRLSGKHDSVKPGKIRK